MSYSGPWGLIVPTSLGQVISVNGVTTVGMGVSSIVKTSTQNAITNVAPTAISYTPAAAASLYRVQGWVEVTTGTTISLKLNITYKTASGATGTDGAVFTLQGSTTLLTAIVTTGRYYFQSPLISIDNSATNITVVDNAGTYTTCVYNYAVAIERLA